MYSIAKIRKLLFFYFRDVVIYMYNNCQYPASVAAHSQKLIDNEMINKIIFKFKSYRPVNVQINLLFVI